MMMMMSIFMSHTYDDDEHFFMSHTYDDNDEHFS